jgi:hypothetical protein
LLDSYNCDSLHADSEDIGCQIPGIGEGVLLPELGEQGVLARNGGAVEDIIALEGINASVHTQCWGLSSLTLKGEMQEAS